MTLREQAEKLGIKIPGPATLAKYGIDEEEWLNLLAIQGWVCPICTRRKVSWNTDHEHVPGWKHLPPQERKRYVRGVLCIHCNFRMVHSRLPADTAQRITNYLRAYEARRDA